MELKKVVLATMGVAMSVCIANAQQWKTHTYGLYSYPLTGNTSNVVIGTTPSSSTSNYKLYVNGNTRVQGNFSAVGTDNYFENGLEIYGTNQQSRTSLWIHKNDASSGMRIGSCGYNNFADLTIDASKMYFNGAYGAKFMELGPSLIKIFHDLEVSGTIKCYDELKVVEVSADQIKAKEINVEMNNAADYVFDENYNLRSLSDVESYVTENKHLPGVPSAAEMAENGMNMAQMSNLLLEKVEELTLHMIELEKENKELKNRVEMLEK